MPRTDVTPTFVARAIQVACGVDRVEVRYGFGVRGWLCELQDRPHWSIVQRNPTRRSITCDIGPLEWWKDVDVATVELVVGIWAAKGAFVVQDCPESTC